jgi:hypothetical protein
MSQSDVISAPTLTGPRRFIVVVVRKGFRIFLSGAHAKSEARLMLIFYNLSQNSLSAQFHR